MTDKLNQKINPVVARGHHPKTFLDDPLFEDFNQFGPALDVLVVHGKTSQIPVHNLVGDVLGQQIL